MQQQDWWAGWIQSLAFSSIAGFVSVMGFAASDIRWHSHLMVES
jgi:hypothetical protein